MLAACSAPQGPATVGGPAQAYPLRDFFRNVDRGYFRLSEDGRWLGYMQPAAGEGGGRRMNIFVQRARRQPPGRRAAPAHARERARHPRSTTGRAATRCSTSKDFGGDENFHVVAVDAAAGRVTDLTPHAETRASIVDPLHRRRRAHPGAAQQARQAAFDVYRIDVQDRRRNAWSRRTRATMSTGGPTTRHGCAWRWPATASTTPCCTAPTRERAVQADHHAPTSAPRSRRCSSTPTTSASTPRATAAATSSALVLIDPARPDDEQVVYEHPKVDLGTASHYSRKRKVLTEATYIVDKPERQVFDPTMRAHLRAHRVASAGLLDHAAERHQGRRQVHRRGHQRPHAGLALPLRRPGRHADQAGRHQPRAARARRWRR